MSIWLALLIYSREAEKEGEKIDHYQDLKVEVQKICNRRMRSVIPVQLELLGL